MHADAQTKLPPAYFLGHQGSVLSINWQQHPGQLRIENPTAGNIEVLLIHALKPENPWRPPACELLTIDLTGTHTLTIGDERLPKEIHGFKIQYAGLISPPARPE